MGRAAAAAVVGGAPVRPSAALAVGNALDLSEHVSAVSAGDGTGEKALLGTVSGLLSRRIVAGLPPWRLDMVSGYAQDEFAVRRRTGERVPRLGGPALTNRSGRAAFGGGDARPAAVTQPKVALSRTLG
ncbi:hypothetical protein GCM10010411_78520 [Actinomadura fulvescens]|uniref:Uncharacterized protein n=1 Tax=Actinomadura fulvescens TaxID=46160 RepID=A0ABP6CYR4_9ACTN